MKKRLARRFLGLFMAVAVLPVGFTACGPAQASSSGSFAGSVAEDSAAPTVAPRPMPDQPYYYSCTAYSNDMRDGYAFLYGPLRNAVSEATYEYYIAPKAPTLPEGVEILPVPASYIATFAGHGLLAGVNWESTHREIQIDVSRDGGTSWEQATLPLEPGEIIDDMGMDFGFTSPAEGWMSVPSEYDSEPRTVRVIATQDGGKTWRQTAVHEVESYNTTLFVTAQHGYMGARMEQGGPLLETWDGGASWQPCPVSLPPGFADAQENGALREFLRSEEGHYGVYYGPLQRGDGNGEKSSEFVQIALVPQQDESGTTWGFESTWEFPPDTDPSVLFAYMQENRYYPWYYGVDYEEDGPCLNHQFLHGVQQYAYTYTPESVTEIVVTIEEGFTDTLHIFPGQLVADYIELVYNIHAFDVTRLTDYEPDVQGFTLSTICGHCGSYQDAVYHSIRVLEGGNIELIRDVGTASDGPCIRRGSGSDTTRAQRCVFRPVTSAHGAEMFTLIECEYLEDYPYAAQ